MEEPWACLTMEGVHSQHLWPQHQGPPQGQSLRPASGTSATGLHGLIEACSISGGVGGEAGGDVDLRSCIRGGEEARLCH